MASTKRIRIRRMNEQFATIGISLGVPGNVSRDSPEYSDIAARAGKLAPGQVVELPSDHFLVSPLHHLLEEVARVGKDEVLRPWVFDTIADATSANLWKSRMSQGDVENALAMSAGAVEKARLAAEAREDAQEAAGVEFDVGADAIASRRRVRPAGSR